MALFPSSLMTSLVEGGMQAVLDQLMLLVLAQEMESRDLPSTGTSKLGKIASTREDKTRI